jgi:site-specific recombinase XerD
VFSSRIGTPLDAANIRRQFRDITEAAGLGRGWAPQELRHTFVSLLSASGTPVEEIARLAGHSSTRTTEVIYRNPRELHQPGEKPQVAWSAQDGSRRRHAIAAAS